MNTKSVVSGLMAVCMMASAPAFAQRYDYGNSRYDQGQQRGDDHNRYQDRAQAERRDRDDRHERNARYDRNERDGRYDRSRQYGQYRAYEGRGYDANRYQMHRGGQLPSEYRGNRYVVDDWRSRRLSAPPRGYQWVEANNDYVLAAIATGLIAQVLLNN